MLQRASQAMNFHHVIVILFIALASGIIPVACSVAYWWRGVWSPPYIYRTDGRGSTLPFTSALHYTRSPGVVWQGTNAPFLQPALKGHLPSVARTNVHLSFLGPWVMNVPQEAAGIDPG
jgi:hypothetical protein